MKRPSALRDPTLLPVAAAALVVLFCAVWLAPLAPRPTALWRGYYTLAAARSSPAARGLADLSARLGRGRPAVTRWSAPVYFADFVGLERTVVADLGRRLDPADPRFDPYMRGLDGYFRAAGGGTQWEIAYIPAFRSRLAVSVSLLASLGPPGRAGWRLIDFDPLAAALSCVACLAYAVLACLPLERRRRRLLAPSLACALLWLPVVAGGGVAVLCLFFLLFAAWHRLMEECVSYARDAILHNWKDPAQREIAERFSAFLVLAFVVPVLLGLATESGPSRIFSLAVTIVSSLLIAFIPFPAYALKKAGRRRRPRFEPVPIVRRRSWPLAYRRALLVAAGTAAAGLCMLSALRGLPLLSPQRIPGVRGLSWESLARSQGVSRPGLVPGLADAAAHAAYQEGLAFGRGYGFPARGERVTVSEYLWSPKALAVVPRQRTVKVYDDAWLAGVFSRAEPASVERMLAAQGRPVAAAAAGPADPVLRDLPLALLFLGALAAGLLAELGIGPLISGKLWRLNIPARRRQPL
jgi:hypothetical protein